MALLYMALHVVLTYRFWTYTESCTIRELTFTFAICCRPSVCLSSVTLVHRTQAVVILGNLFKAFGTLAIR